MGVAFNLGPPITDSPCTLLISMQVCINHGIILTGTLILSPSPRAVVCQDVDKLEVTCSTIDDKSSLKWRLSMGMTDLVQDISISSTTVVIQRVMVNSSRIKVSRASEIMAAPLISILEISSVREDFNGTLNISCMELGVSDRVTATMATTVYIAGGTQGESHIYYLL